MPALAQALSGALPEAALRQLMQSLGNCQQPLTHRGAINIQPPRNTGAGGLARPGTWRTSDYQNLLPSAGQDGYFDIAGGGGRGGTTVTSNNSTNYDGHQFQFPINQDFNYSNYYGGDTFNVAGNSTFDNSTVTNLKAGDMTVSRLTVTNRIDNITNFFGGGDGGGQGGGGEVGPGGGGGGGFGGFPFPGVPQPAETRVITYLKDVTVTGNVVAPTVESAKIKDDKITLTPGTQTVPLTVTGSVEVPVAQSGTLAAITATGSITIPAVTGGSLSGATASGTISYDTYDKATCGPVSGTVSIPTGGSLSGATASGTVNYDTYPTATCGAITASVQVPTVGTFSATPTGIAAAWGGLGSFSGSITIPVVTGGSLDASCKFVPTTTNQTFTVNFTGTPTVSITSQGTVAGSVTLTQPGTSKSVTVSTPTITLNKSPATVTPTFTVNGGAVALSGSTNAALSITPPTITPTKTSASVTPTFTVTGGTFTPTTSSSTQAVTVTTSAATVTITNSNETRQLSATGEIQAPITKTAALADSTVSLTAGTSTKDLKLKVVKKSDFLIYLRPRA
jgi:hypothetical protein